MQSNGGLVEASELKGKFNSFGTNWWSCWSNRDLDGIGAKKNNLL